MTRTLSHLGLFAVAMIYGANYIIAKSIMGDGMITPFAFILCRCIAGAFLFWIVGALFVRESVDKADWPKMVLAGALGVAVNQLCFFSGLAITSPIHGSLIMIMTPIIIVIGSAVWLQERVGIWRIAGIIIGFVGAAVLIISADGGSAVSSVRGDLLILVNATSYACYLLLIKTLITKYHPLTVVRWAYTFGLLMVLPFGLRDTMGISWSAFQPHHWQAFAYVLLCTTFLAYLLNALCIKHLSPSTVGSYIYLQPLIAALLAVVLGVDRLGPMTVLAGALIFLGVYLVANAKKKQGAS